MTTQEQPPTKKLKSTTGVIQAKQPPLLLLKATTEADHKSSPRIEIYAELIILGPANVKPIRNGCVVIENGKIQSIAQIMHDVKSANDELDRKSKNKSNRCFYTKVLMPGMWDVHTHFIGAKSRSTPTIQNQWNSCFEDRAVKVGRDISKLGQVLNSGFTSVREVGGLGKHLKLLVKEGTAPGPHIYHANVPIHITGGHCDLPSDIPLSCYGSICTVQDADGDGALFGTGSDGTADCLKSVRRNLRAGADVIKLCCSGGVMSQTEGLPTEPQFSPHEIKTMTEEASRHNVIVCAHCHSAQGILNALHNGVKCIEHGTLADDKCIQLMIEKDAILVPTRWVIEELVGEYGIDGPRPAGMSEHSWKKMKMVFDASTVAHKAAIKAGVRIAVGCDVFVSEGYGTSGKEMKYLVDLGMTPAQAIEAATVNGPLCLGPIRAPKSGTIKVGFDADLIFVDSNPLDDITILANPDRIPIVIKGGILVKNTTTDNTLFCQPASSQATSGSK